MGTAKIFEAGAFGLEYSRQAAPHGGWGDNLSANKLDDKAGFPWLSFSNQPNISTVKDNSITSNAFETGSRIVTKTIDNDLSFHNRFEGVNVFIAWMFGWEGKAVNVVAFAVDDKSIPITIGDQYSDLDSNDYYFLRYEQYRDMEYNLLTLAIFDTNGLNVEPSDKGAGILTAVTAVGNDLPYNSTSATMYEHLYELSKDGRRLRDFTPEEILALGNFFQTGDQRCLFGTLAKRYTEFQVRYANALSKKMDIKWTPADLSIYESGYMAFREERKNTGELFDGNVIDTDYDMDCSLSDVTNVIAHYQTRVEIGKRGETTMNEYGITEFNVGVEIPLQNLQDTVSGVYLADPFLEGKYTITSSMTISRLDGKTFSDYRDNLQKLRARISANRGFLMQEILIKEFTITKAGDGGADVADEPIDLSINFSCEDHDFIAWLSGQTEINKSPIVMRTRDYNKFNMLLGRDQDGLLIY